MEFGEFYNKLTNILEIYKFVLQSKVCPQTSTQEWLKIITYLYLKDWLWVVTEDSKIKAVIGVWRVNEFDASKADDIPAKDEGNILFVPFACSVSEDLLVWRKLFKEYLKINKINELILCDYLKDGYNVYRRFKIGVQNESTETQATANAELLPEPVAIG